MSAPAALLETARDIFADEQSTLLLMRSLYEMNNDWGTKREDVVRVCEAWRATAAETGVRVVFRCSESPIERQFLCSLIVSFVINAPLAYAITEPSPDVMGSIKTIRTALAYMAKVDRVMGAKPGSKNGFWSQADEDARNTYLRYVGMGAQNKLHITPQAGMKLNGKKMRLDFLAWVPAQPKVMVAIECDGFEWHGTKDKFASDRARDRALKAAGIDTLRLAGSEIHNKLDVVTGEVVDFLLTQAERGGR